MSAKRGGFIRIKHSNLKRPETIIIVFLVGTAVANYVPDFFVVVFYLAIITWAFVLAYQHFSMRKAIKVRFGGEVSSAFAAPKPLSSMLRALELQGHTAKDIAQIDMMTYDLEASNEYLRTKGKGFCAVLRENTEIKANIFGSGKIPQTCLSPNIKFNHTSCQLTEHLNKIITKEGEKYLWYEPQHIVKNGVHDLSKGAYLVKIEDEADWKKVEEKFAAALH